jgi:hypothetical protein
MSTKILFISQAELPDFQSDMVFHGLRSIYGENCVDHKEMWYMYSDTKSKYWNSRVPNGGNSYGRGFTLYGRLPNISVDRSNLVQRIKNKEFDKIVYGSVHRCLDHFDEVVKHYSPENVVFIDGEDQTNIKEELLQFGIYRKRELVYSQSERLKPIIFCIPKECIVDHVPEKTKEYGTVIPGDTTTYIFDKEDEYHQDYQKSYYGVTTKKGGWDCLRHYEIIMNGCFPYFPNLESCPKNTMTLFPKNLVLENNRSLEKNGLSINYKEETMRLLKYAKKYLTTEYTAKIIIENI